MHILILFTVFLIIGLLVEYYRHYKKVMSIPIRIHINGTRGKSSVTRLIAAGMREGGIKTIAKTTGTMPRVILEDGVEASIERLGNTNIIEQKYVFRYAASKKPEAIVIECMAVNPAFQWITERRFVHSTISVLTNSRPDHQDLMGDSIESITMCLSNTIPEKGVFFTSEVEQFAILKSVADKRNTETHQILPDGITIEELDGFSYIEHPENVALSLSICAHLGISRKTALKGMQKAIPDPGALTKYKISDSGKNMQFYNVFAANDPESTKMIWEKVSSRLNNVQKMIILNGRADRYFRSKQLIDVSTILDYDFIFLTGERTDHLLEYAYTKEIPKEKILSLGEIPPNEVYEIILKKMNKEAHIFGIGNIAGKNKYGAQIVNYFREKSKGGN